MRRVLRTSALTTLVLASLLLVVGCGPKRISSILDDPSQYSNRNVQIEGQVTESYSVANVGAYQIDDGSGRIWIVSSKGVPRKGAEVSAKGKVREGYNLGSLVSLPKQLDSGVVLVESSHKTKD